MRVCAVLVLMWGLLCASAQTAGAQTERAREFEVVSIKPNGSGQQGGAWGVSENRFRAKNTPLQFVILQAYSGAFAAPPERLKGAPAWVTTEGYDITAKVDDATADSWKGLRQAQQIAIAAPMLRKMLEDRCKLVVHTVPMFEDGYELVVGKNGSKMKPAPPDEPLPEKSARFEGGWAAVYPQMKPPGANRTVTYVRVTLADLVQFMSLGGKPILDHTGLTGKYDFDLPMLDDPAASANPDGGAPPPRPDAAHLFDWKAIGLEVRSIKVPAVGVVVDHIERPTAD